jgi:hypothetical protein
MNPDLESKLLDKYPKLFASKQFWGFECGDGWYDILDNLCGSIASYGNVDDVMVDQVKEKFGQLRFYVVGGDDKIDGMIWMAEHMSGHTCEICGERGELRTGSWLVTLCDMHHDARTGKIPHGHT